MTTVEEIHEHIGRWDQGAWCLAALALTLSDAADEDQRRAADEVLRALGIAAAEDLPEPSRSRIGAQATAPLVQIAALLGGRRAWLEQPDDALLAQGRSSAQAAPMFAQFVLPQLGDLGERLTAPGCRMLDVGTGVGAMAVGYAETFPELTVVGIDVLPRVLELAQRVVAESAARARVELREQDVASLADDDAFDLVWIPAPFVPEESLREGLTRIATALRPDGWVTVGHGRFGGNALEDALTMFKTRAYGGTPLDSNQAQQLLRERGFSDVKTLATPSRGPALTVGRRGS
jgi:SAM-dependent methyltransferase